MKKARILSFTTGIIFIILGALLVASLLGWIDSSSIYDIIIPILIICGGVTTLQDDSKHKKTAGFGLILIGLITLLVKFSILHGDVVNGILGAILLIAGTSILSKNSQTTDGDVTEKSDSK